MIDFEPLFGPQNSQGCRVTFRVFPRSGPARWMLETRFREPWHLKTWPRVNLRARLIYRAAWLLARIGMHLPFRRVDVTVSDGSVYDLISGRFDVLGVFLGTVGPNRKVVVYAKGADGSWFVKVPISPASAKLVRTEAKALGTLVHLVPRSFWIGEALAIEDVEQQGTSYKPLSVLEIIRVHRILFDRSSIVFPLRKLVARLNESNDGLRVYQDAETRTAIEETRRVAGLFLQSFDADTPVECYMAHGDFTRWNVLRARDGTARIIDWELFGLRPKFFDPFHYLVAQAILVDRKTPDAILAQVECFTEAFDDLQTLHFYFGMYLANQALSYCLIFERQSVIHAQAFWQLHTWRELLTELNLHPVHTSRSLEASWDQISETKI